MKTQSVESIPINRRKCRLKDFLEHSVLEPLKVQAQSVDIKLSLTVLAPLPNYIYIDPEKIGWVIASLIGNSLRYVKHGSRNLPGGSIAVAVNYDLNSEKLIVTVSDDGPGIPLERIPWLFEHKDDTQPFFGLALHLAYQILQAHGGSIRVESKSDESDPGTSFTLELSAQEISS